jgi:hypothetical protein
MKNQQMIGQLALIPQTQSQQERQRKSLVATIKKQRTKLQKLVLRNEMLKVQLEMLKREYMVKIGSLIVKDNHLDLDIIRYRNIISLMEQGKTFAEAYEALAKTYYAEQLELEQEEETIHVAEEILEKGEQQKSEEVQVLLKKLWRNLVSKFHPDLTQDPHERKRREEIMKQINLAYEEGDAARLEKIDREQTSVEETSLENLQEILITIENEILEQEKLYLELQESEWYDWSLKMKKSKKSLKDIFSDTEKKLLDSIVAKLEIIKELKDKIARIEKGEYA